MAIKLKSYVIEASYRGSSDDVPVKTGLNQYNIPSLRTLKKKDSIQLASYERQKISQTDQLIKTIQTLIASESAEELRKLLAQDFLIQSLGVYTEAAFNAEEEKQAFQVNQFEKFEVRSNLEQLLLTFNSFRTILKRPMTLDIKRVLLVGLKDLDLAVTEVIDFTGMDLTEASFKGANLGCSVFMDATLEGVNFSYANLTHCTLTQEQLDQSATYDKAQVPAHLSVYWNDEIKKKLKEYLIHLLTYAMEHVPENDSKFIKINQLLKDYGAYLELGSSNPSIEVKKKMLEDFRSAKTLFSEHRNLNFLFGEVLAFLGLLVIGYLVVGCYNYKKSGHFGLFSQPPSEAKAKELLNYIEQVDSGLLI